MDTTEHEAFVNDYQKKVDEMDTSVDHLDSNARMEYEKDRDSFKEHLSRWEDNVEDKWDGFKADTEHAWANLKNKFSHH